MEELLSKIYDRIVIYGKDCIALGTEFDQKVAEKLEPMKESISEDELEKLKELIYWGGIFGRERRFPTGSKIHVETVDGNSVTRRTVMILASRKTALFLCL